MIDKGKIIELKIKGEIILSNSMYKKWVNISSNGHEYKGNIYKNIYWLLTYGREQYYWLTNGLNTLR